MDKRRVINSGLGILMVAAIIVWAAVFSQPTSNFAGWFLNVGQGDATYLRFPDGHDALIDGGPGPVVLTELGEVMPFYDRELDLAILTHNHSDHLAGLVAVLERYEVREVWLSGAVHTSSDYIQLLKVIKEKKIPLKIVKVGGIKQFGQVKGEVIFPLESWQGQRPTNQHQATVVTRWSYGRFQVLITGDLEEKEERLIEQSKQNIAATILKVPHHGSATGLSDGFLQLVAPTAAVISVGANNQYGHPAETILKLLHSRGVKIYRTDHNGRVGFTSDGISYELKAAKN